MTVQLFTSPGTNLSGLGTDNRTVRWDGTDTLQSSGLSIDDLDVLTLNGNIVAADNSITGLDTLTFTDTDGTIAGIANGNLLDKSAVEAVSGVYTFSDKVVFTQTDGNEYIDSEADGDLDLSATTSIDFNIGGSEDLALTANTLTFADSTNIVFNTTTGTQIGTGTTQKLSFYGVTPVVQQTALTTQDTSLTHTAPGTPDFALQDLVDSGVGSTFGFATKDEGNTVLRVILNLQTRLTEVETKLQALGLVA